MRVLYLFDVILIYGWDDHPAEQVEMSPSIKWSQNILMVVLHGHVLWLRHS